MEALDILKPGEFGLSVAADTRRREFDAKNEVIVAKNIPVDIVFAGDSITHLWELQAYFGNRGKMILNRGISGDVSSYLLKRLDADVIQLRPKKCVLLIGINNAWDLEPDLWLSGKQVLQKAQILEAFQADLRGIAQKCRDASIELVLCSLLPTCMKGNLCEAERKQYAVEANAFLRALALEQGLVYVDYHIRLVDGDGLTAREKLFPDGIHPNVWGYDLMAQALEENGVI